MNNAKRLAVTTVASVVISAVTATAALAFNWGTLYVSYNGYTAGAGYGSVSGTGWDGMTIYPWLKDTRTDGVRTYAEAQTSGNYGKVQSDRRADGGSTFANMANKTTYTGGYTGGQYTTVKVCMDWSWHSDPCSGKVSGNL